MIQKKTYFMVKGEIFYVIVCILLANSLSELFIAIRMKIVHFQTCANQDIRKKAYKAAGQRWSYINKPDLAKLQTFNDSGGY